MSLPRGHLRWERARKNAVENPTSKNAKMYFDRMVRVADAVERLGNLESPMQVFRPNASFDCWVCSTRCACTHLTLDGAFSTSAMLEMYADRVAVGEPARSPRCMVCGDVLTKSEFGWLESLKLLP